jgi:hypothetical protein
MILRMAQVLLILIVVFLVRVFLNRNMPRAGGKIGRVRTIDAPASIPDGFSRVYARDMTVFIASADAANFGSLKAFLRHGTVERPALMRIFCVAGCNTEIEISIESPDYERIEAAEALALLRELPDLRLIHRLHLSDESSFLDPWVRRVAGQQFVMLGNATNFKLVVLYRPDRRLRQIVGLTLLHEWLHMVAFGSARDVWRFERANAIEPLAPCETPLVSFGVRKAPIYESWCDLGEKIFGYDETIAREAALAYPIHAMILWKRVEKILRKGPEAVRSSRFAEFEARGAFMHAEVDSKAAWRRRSPADGTSFRS